MRCRGCGFVVVGGWVLVLGDRGDCLLGWLSFVKGGYNFNNINYINLWKIVKMYFVY